LEVQVRRAAVAELPRRPISTPALRRVAEAGWDPGAPAVAGHGRRLGLAVASGPGRPCLRQHGGAGSD